jgi:Zn-dependent M16 (insulinase) family peptidase
MTQRYLLPRIREQGGAYGASASANSPCASFAMTSYRDPRGQATHDDFDRAASWLLEQTLDEEMLREGILACIAGIDTPQGPVAEAGSRFLADLRGDGPDIVDPFRKRILAVNATAIQSCTERYLLNKTSHRACIGPEALRTELHEWEQIST